MSVKDLTDGQILTHLRNNTILRNGQLSILVKLLNSLKDSATLAIDGAWGSGKTVFVKQLMMLADSNVEDYGHNTLDEVAIEALRENQKTFYFNAWENDYLGDALSAILLKLIAESDPSLDVESLKRVFSAINPGAALKKVSFDLYNPDGKPRKDKLIEDIKPIVNRHDAVNDFIDAIKGDNKRLIFIIDELDRCKPSFAIDLLEVVKHYFVRDDVTFIIATNINELSHTIKRYYGDQFDGYKYLNKFFDFTINLQRVDIGNYAKTTLNWVPGSYIVHNIAHDIIQYYDLQMREINSYHSALRMIDRFLSRDGNWRDEQYPIQFIFVPLALALKIRSNSDFVKLSTGKGEKILRDFLPNTSSGMNYASRWVKDKTGLTSEQIKTQSVDAIVEQYKALFIPEYRRMVNEDLQDFYDAISLISSYTTISSPEGTNK